MEKKSLHSARPRGRSNRKAAAPAGPQKPWRQNAPVELTREAARNLYQVDALLTEKACETLGLRMQIPVFLKDPLTVADDPDLCIREIRVRLEPGMRAGPTSARVAVVDFNADTHTLTPPVEWDEKERWFRRPEAARLVADPGWLPSPPAKSAGPAAQRLFIEQAARDPYFHQVNVWAVVQQTLEFFEDPQALGRPAPWGFDGNRLIVVPHAGYGQNAFYDPHSKSLQFYYFGDRADPGYTCLSHDIIAHETGHAILDGIRPLYNQNASLQTAAFHEFIGDLTAILLTLHNRDVRRFVSATTHGDLDQAAILADLARQFGEEVQGRPYLRTAFYNGTLYDVQDSLSHHRVSQVLTAAMFDILMRIAEKLLDRDLPDNPIDPSAGDGAAARRVTPAQALWWAAERLRRIAIQPLDLCPPCDIQFIDYARAVIRNDLLTNPVDSGGYRRIMLDVFHERKLCACAYRSGEPLPVGCAFHAAFEQEDLEWIAHDIGRVSRSRTAAYYFLHDNRAQLRIPAHQDIVVSDLYDANKNGAAAERLPRAVVLAYTWQEQLTLQDDPRRGWAFGAWNGRTLTLDCGGALVFDERGNLLSWFRKPGVEHLSALEEQQLLERRTAWEQDPAAAHRKKVRPLTKLERASLQDLEDGRARRQALCDYLARLVGRGLAGAAPAGAQFSDTLKPLIILEQPDGSLRFEMAAQARENEIDEEVSGWKINF